MKTAEPIQASSQQVENQADDLPTQSETIQRQPLKAAEPVQSSSPRTEKQAEALPTTAGTVQRETLKTAEPIHAQGDSVVEREIAHSNNMLSGELSESLHTPASSAKMSSGNSLVQRAPLDTDSTSGDDIGSLLSSLPTHYEMPREQIEAIRSGQNDTAQHNAVQREYVPSHAENSLAENVNATTAAPMVENTIQREPNFVLPSQRKKSNTSTSENEPVIRRESKPAQASPVPAFNSSMHPGSGFFSSNSNNFNKPQNMYPGVNSAQTQQPVGVIQRDMLDDVMDKFVNSESTGSKTVDDSTGEVEEILPEVTPRDLEILADRLLPRIKRIMRAEMERSIFR